MTHASPSASPADAVLTDDDGHPVYRHKPRPVGFEIAATLEPKAIRVRTPRRDERIPYARIAVMRLSYRPANLTSHGFRTTLTFTDGRTFSFGNLDWMSLVDVRRKDGEYRAFVRELAPRVAAANPRCRFVVGRSAFVWWATVVMSAALIVPLTLFLLRAAGEDQWTAAALGAAAAGLFGWQIAAIILRNKPGAFAPDAIPERVLP